MIKIDVRSYLENEGLTPISLETFNWYIRRNLTLQERYDLEKIWDDYTRRGDAEGTKAWYTFSYGKRIEELDCSFSELWIRTGYLNCTEAILPHIAHFCESSEVSNVLDCGCGEGINLGYLSLCFPEKSFTGIDRIPEAIELSKKRLERLGVKNGNLICTDCYAFAQTNPDPFDSIIMLNILDDEREAWSDFQELLYDTQRKTEAIRPLLKDTSKIFLSLLPYPESEFKTRLLGPIESAGFKISQSFITTYEMNQKSHDHYTWILEL